MPRITAIVPATNAPPTLDACTEAIRSAEEPPDELIVVDDASLVGPGAARNAGARDASGDVLVFVDADVVVHPDAFRRIRAVFDADPELTALFGSYDDAPAAEGVVSAFRNLLHHHVHSSSPGPASTFWAGLGAVKRDAFLAVGGFDAERYARPSIEDIELGMRLFESGARILLEPQIRGTHLKAWSLYQMLETDLLRRGIPWVQLLAERGGGSSALNLSWKHRLSTAAVVTGTAALLTGRFRLAGAAATSFVALNAPFYALLVRRRGPVEGVAGIGLHALHHLTAAAAVPAGIAAHLLEGRGSAGGKLHGHG